MSFLTKLFGGGGSESKPPTAGEAIQRLREIEDMLMKKEEFLEKKVEQELQTAKKNGTKNKRVALQALKRKKRYEKQLLQIGGTLTTIEFQREALENASTNTEVLKVMGYAAKALKGAHDYMDVDKLHDLMDDIQEQQTLVNEMSDAISTPFGVDRDFDEEELTKELEALEQKELDEALLDVGPTAEELPSPPSTEPARPVRAKAVEVEDEDLKELAQWAA